MRSRNPVFQLDVWQTIGEIDPFTDRRVLRPFDPK